MGDAFIVDWFQHSAHPEEIHALIVQLDELTGLYRKCLLRVVFPDFAYILFAQDPEPALIDRARRANPTASMRLTRVRTIAGYQPTATTPALLVRAPDLACFFKDPNVKALGGYIEENTVISRSRKLTALRSMAQCCWISLGGVTVIGDHDPQRLAKRGIPEYLIPSWENLNARPLDTKEAFTPPPSSAIRVTSFDIEVFKPSKRGGGMPDPEDRANFVLCISAVTHEKSTLIGDPENKGNREVTLHTVYDVARPEEYVPPGTKINRYATEYEMIRGFWDQIAQDDPVLILGFNVQSWDFRYLNSRMKLHGISYPSALSIYARPPERNLGMRRAHWSSDAFKNNDMLWPDIPGMVVLDLHKFYVRSRPALRKHSLDYISRHHLGRGKFPVSQQRMVAAYETGDADELSAMAQYNIEDSMLVLDLYLSQRIFDEAALEALTSETLLDDLYTKGMQIRALNKIYRYAKEDGYVVSTSPTLSIARGLGGGGGESQLVGALVQGSSPGRYDDVAVYDIRSMYPTLLMSRNVCYTTFLTQPAGPDTPEHQVFPWETKSGDPERPHETHHASFVTENVHRGLCSRLLADQVALRERIRTWGGDDDSGIARYAQRGVKAVSNSIIGLMGAVFDNSRLSFPAAAGVVYTAARTAITAIIQDVSGWEGAPHGQVVYSDTDSVLVAGMPRAADRHALLRYLNDKYAPFVFELETVGRLLLVGPKNYIMRLNDGGSLVYKGVSFSRRNSSDFVADTMREITEMIMDATHSRADILAYLKNRVDGVKDTPLDSFVMSATVSTAASSVGGKLGRRLVGKGAILMPGDVVDYLVLTKPVSECEPHATTAARRKKVLGVTDRTATPEEFAACSSNSVDYEYYTEKLRSSAEQLLVFDK